LDYSLVSKTAGRFRIQRQLALHCGRSVCGELARLSRDGHLPKERVVNLSRVRTTCGSGWVELEKRADQLTLETHNTQTSFVFFRVFRGYDFSSTTNGTNTHETKHE